MEAKGSNGDFAPREGALFLDVVRGFAAIAVLLGHAVQLGLYTGDWPFSELFQHDAVVLFFVLSGALICNSTMRPGVSLRSYATARARRILPVAWVAIMLGVAACLIRERSGFPSVAALTYRSLSPEAILSSLLFLCERLDLGAPENPPFWSLCYEVFFYALFGATLFLKSLTRALVLGALVFLAGIKVLLLMPVWLEGVAVVAIWQRWRPGPLPACALVLLSIGGFCLLGTQAVGFGVRDALGRTMGVPMAGLLFSQFAATDLVLGLLVGMGFLGARALSDLMPSMPGATLLRLPAIISFSLYASHWPVITAMRSLGIQGSPNFGTFLLLLIIPVVVATLISRICEAPLWRSLARNAAGGRPSPMAAAA
jgi:peptidoglycan/LPS O-acetylase OafA/YrhL